MTWAAWSRLDAPTRRCVVAMGLTALGLMLWGLHGNASLLGSIDARYWGPGTDPSVRPTLVPGIAWDDELLSFVVGAVACVALPAVVLKFGRREALADYGLALPPAGRRGFALLAFSVIVLVFALPFGLTARTAPMRDLYPLFRGPLEGADFVAYEGAYLLFFVALDGLLRGVLLFGVAGPALGELPLLAIASETLVQAVWHLGKPTAEALGAPVWGVVGGYVAVRARSVWPVISAHWVLNVLIDFVSIHSR